MKKLVSVLFALLLIGSFAFAADSAVSVGTWSRFIFVPMSGTTKKDVATNKVPDNTAFTGPSWANGSRVGLGFSASSDQAGMKLDIHSNGNALAVGDQAKIWVQPIPMVKIQAGKVQEDTLRGKFDDSNVLNGLAGFNGVPGKDTYFTRFYPKLGIVASLTPAEGIFIAAALDAENTVDETISIMQDTDDNPATPDVKVTYKTGGTKSTYTGLKAEDMFKKIQIGGGYTIADLGLLRAQYIGGLDKAPAWMEAAFAYTAMEGVLVDAGLKFNVGEAKTAKNSVAVAGSYTKDALYALVRTYYAFGDATKATPKAGDKKAEMKFSTDVAYKVADPLSLGLEAAFDKHDKPVKIDVMPYVQIASGAGKLKAGYLFESYNKDASSTGKAYTSWAIPVMVEVGF